MDQSILFSRAGYFLQNLCFQQVNERLIDSSFCAILTLIYFSSDYPLNPPKMSFLCEMFHPNIFPDGRVCISILHSPGDDPLGYESSSERWSPVQSVEKILLSVVSMLAEPNDESPANVDVLHSDERRNWKYQNEWFSSFFSRHQRCGGRIGMNSIVSHRGSFERRWDFHERWLHNKYYSSLDGACSDINSF